MILTQVCSLIKISINNIGVLNAISDTIAFYAALVSYDSIADDTPVIWDEVRLNEGNG